MKTSVLKNIWRVGVVLLVNLLVIAVAFYFAGGPDAIETLSRYGSTGEEVRQIQTKLNELGYDTGGIDGTYGTKTKNAVIAFQKSQGLSADGIAGPKTLEALGIGSSGSSGGGSYSDSDVYKRQVQGFPLSQTVTEDIGLFNEFLIVHFRIPFLFHQHSIADGLDPFELPLAVVAKQ